MISERDVIYITKKQASIAVVALATFCMVIFMLGYFWGKQCVLDGFGQRIAQESMSDAADYELMMQSFADRTKSEQVAVDNAQESNQTESEQLSDMQGQLEPGAAHHLEAAEVTSLSSTEKEKDKKNSAAGRKPNKAVVAHKKHHATLIGFAVKQSAADFVQRLQNRGIVVHVKTRVSKSASGKTKKMWYQVVTGSYDSMDELEQVIAQIIKTERIKRSDIKIN